MDNVNVLESGVWELEKLREQILLLDQYKAELASQDVVEEQLEQQLNMKQQMIQNEINEMINKRENEIIQSFEEQRQRQRNKLKKVQDKKKKSKSEKVSERINYETASLREENTTLRKEAKQVFQQANISSIFQNRFYFSLFAPKAIGDFLIAALFFVIMFAALPKVLYFLFDPTNRILYYILIYIVISIIVFGGYYICYKATKQKNEAAVWKVRDLRYQMLKNRGKINKIKRKIQKDKDESGYHLGSYDKEMKTIESKILEITEEQNQAIMVLKNNTSTILANEVRAKYQMDVSDLTKVYEDQKEKTQQIEEKIKEATSNLTSEYQMYLGTELMNVVAVDDLIHIMNTQDVRSVSEALQIYRSELNKQAQ